MVAVLATSAPAGAEVSDTHVIDGPSAEVVGAADAAMAEDGSGGVVYLRKAGGRNHVFVARFSGGAWGAPQRVDIGQEFDSSWAQIAAGTNGRLLVTWVQEFGVGTDRMFSATLDPGAQGFQAPVPVDFNVGEATSTFPDLAMNAGGQAYLTYVVVTDTSALNPPGYVGASIRVARYNNRLWSTFGSPVNRNPATPLRQPTEASGPRVGIDLRGNGVVAWQEPDDEFIDRVWARRLFGTSVGIPLAASPSSWEGSPVRAAADAFSLDVTGFGQAAVAVRQQPGQSGALTAPRLFVAEMPDAFSPEGKAFTGARLADGGVKAGLGAPSVAVEPNGAFLTGFAAGASTFLAAGDPRSISAPNRADQGGSTIAGEPLVDLAETGAAVAAWREQRGASGTVAVREQRADGVIDPAALRSPSGGVVTSLRLGGSGLGDALLTWTQGSGANAQVVAAVVDAPPDPFNVETPEGWKRQAEVTIHWPQATNAVSSVKYSVSVDDEPLGKATRRLFAKLKTKRVGDGRHRVQVFAIDQSGQQTGSRNGVLLIDRKPPGVKLRRHGRRLTVILTDGARRETSGVKASAVKIAFGDGTRSGRAPRHVFDHAGSYRVRVTAADRAGNVVHLVRAVRVG
ncbi:MAG: PKD domain-containing protein [Thermoleophilia bacterium]|nr:PKD domain-containing protein [Thermoleophilia bacterium]